MAMRVQNDLSQNCGSGQHSLLASFSSLLDDLEGCFVQKRTLQRAKSLAISLLCSDAPHTLTNWIVAAGKEQEDWSANYYFFSKACWDAGELFDVVLSHLGRHLGWSEDFHAAIDEVHLPKSGRKIPGVRTLRDPLALPFAKGLHRALRFINVCSMIPSEHNWKSSTRAMCVGFEFTPPAKKPGKKASDEEMQVYQQASKDCAISKCGRGVIGRLRERMDHTQELSEKRLVVSLDGGFTNKATFGDVPERTVLIGRIRKDARLYSLPPPYCGKGRKRRYGDALPTPEQIRKAPCTPWQEMEVWAAGKIHRVRYKDTGTVLWKTGAKDNPVRVLIVEPLGYRPSKRSKLQYKDPAYLAVSDVTYDVEDALQGYFHHWQIEVSHRDAKSIMGVGDPQVRHPLSVERLPQFVMTVYSLILLGALEAYGPERVEEYGLRAKWRNDRRIRASVQDIVHLVRHQAQQAGTESFVDFVSPKDQGRSPQNAKQMNLETAQRDGEPLIKPHLTNCLRC